MKILFVCTGNTCRSPMAEGIFKSLIQKDGLDDRIFCQSAGLSAVEDDPVSENAAKVMKELDIDISGHCARRITGEELPVWDWFFPMSKTHAYILEQAGAEPNRIYIPSYIPDPFGQGEEVYRGVRDKLTKEVEKFYRETVKPQFVNFFESVNVKEGFEHENS